MIAATVVVIIILAGMIVWWGTAIQILWGWFVAPILGLPAIGLAEACGLKLFMDVFCPISMVSHRIKTENENDEVKAIKTLGVIFFMPLIAVIVGYIITLFM